MYAEGKSQEAVMAMLIEENADERQIAALAERFYQDYLFLLAAKRKQLLKKADTFQLVGAVLLSGSLVLTVISYLFSDGGYYVTFNTLSVIGIVCLAKAFLNKRSAVKEYTAPNHF
jgi:hypothetical protein